MEEAFNRTALLLGEQALQSLQKSTIAVFGMGGVGSFAVEALARAGVGHFVLVDHDVVTVSNFNRQLFATYETIGHPKVDVAKSRIHSIRKETKVTTHPLFFSHSTDASFLRSCDYIVDAIDTVASKVALIEYAYVHQIPILSCMGTGNKLNPRLFEVEDIMRTSVCPLCRIIRRELRKRGIPRLKVVYSKELPHPHLLSRSEDLLSSERCPRSIGSISYVPSTAGLLMAAEVINDILSIR